MSRVWRLEVTGQAQRQLDRLPESAAGAIIETLLAIRANPRRLGKPLALALALALVGRFSARRGPYRVIYELDDRKRFVRVVAIGHRRDVYRRT